MKRTCSKFYYRISTEASLLISYYRIFLQWLIVIEIKKFLIFLTGHHIFTVVSVTPHGLALLSSVVARTEVGR
jgi:hypothetical protein